MNKLLRLIVTAILFGCPLTAMAQYFNTGGIAYHILSEDEHTVEVITKWPFYSGNVVIPATATYDGTTYDVVAIGEYAFYGTTLSGITIPTSVTRICAFAFYAANTPTVINIPASVTDIGHLAFAANRLTTISVDEGNPAYCSIDGMLFSKDTSTIVESPITKSGTLVLPENTRHIEELAFAYCQSLTGITLPDSLESIGYGAFIRCSSLNNVVIPASVTRLGSNPFGGCSALTALAIEAGNTHYYMDGMMVYTMATDTLLSCHKSADSLYLPSTLRAVGGLSSNSDVRYVHLPDGVTTVLENAFEGSTLQSIDLPGSITFIDEYAFCYCQSLTHIDLPATLDSMGEGCFENCTYLASIVIPDGMRTVPKEAFYGCARLSGITWGNAVEVVDSFAFGGCAFTELLLPPTLRTIRCGGFNGYDDGHLNRVEFTAQIDTIDMEAFYGHHMLTMVFRNMVPPVTPEEYGCFETAPDSIVIPCGSLDAWTADSYWGRYAAKYHEDCNSIDRAADTEPSVVPNPATSLLTVGGTGTGTIELINALGQTVLTHTAADGDTTIDVGQLPRGAYILRLHSHKELVTKKIVLM